MAPSILTPGNRALTVQTHLLSAYRHMTHHPKYFDPEDGVESRHYFQNYRMSQYTRLQSETARPRLLLATGWPTEE